MKPVTVSVVIPAYNAEACLAATLESVLAQTRPADEIIVIDDGSRDHTAEVARSFGDRIRYIPQTNGGIAAARNAGVREAKSEWIAFLDHDDLMLPDKLEKQVAVLERKPDLQVVYAGFKNLYEDGSSDLMPAFPAVELWPALRYRTPILPSTAIIRRAALLEVGGFRNVYCVDDWNLWYRLIRRYSKDAFQDVPEILTVYRRWANSESNNFMPLTKAVLNMLDTLLLSDLTGLRRAVWKRRVEARVYFSMSLSLRELHHERYWEYALGSFLSWPLPSKVVPNQRYRVLAHMLLTKLRHPRPAFRFWWPVRRCREGLDTPLKLAERRAPGTGALPPATAQAAGERTSL